MSARKAPTAEKPVRRGEVDWPALLSILVHDLRTPLSTISMTASSLSREAPGDRAAHLASDVERVLRNVRRMNHLLRDVLDLSRIETGTLRVEMAAHEIGPVLDEAIEAIRPLAGRRRIALVTDAAHRAVEVACDRERVLQVLGNLLDNAVKFTAERGDIAVRLSRTAREVVVEIADDGRGIAPDEIPRIFDAHAHPRRRAVREGIGLGLHIAHALIEAQGGRLWVESEPARGSTFRFSLANCGPTVSASAPAAGGLPSSASQVIAVVPVAPPDHGGGAGTL